MANCLSHKIRLVPTRKQEMLLRRCVGTARFAYNWALTEWERQYAAKKEDSTLKNPNEGALRKQLNAVKYEKYPWMSDVPKSVVQQAVKNLGQAFHRFFKKQGGYPVRHKKGHHDSARLDNGPGTFKCCGRKIHLPILGWVKMREELRFSGRPLSTVVSCTAGCWFVAIQVEVPDENFFLERTGDGVVGVDLGIKTAVVCSNGDTFEAPKPLKKELVRLARAQRKVARRKKGSNRRRKAVTAAAKLHARIARIRNDWTHKITTKLVRENQAIGLEDLNVSGMLRNHKLARAIADIGFGEIRRQVTYKALRYASELVLYPRFEPSSKKCHVCRYVLNALGLSEREWNCPRCGAHHDRDLNAAKNIEIYTTEHRLVPC